MYIGDVRRMYGRNAIGRDTIDFDYTEKTPVKSHICTYIYVCIRL
jgi:hypothetical protein